MKNRPVLKLPLSKPDKILEWLAIIALIALWSETLIGYITLPQTIPVHFDLKGNIDDYGSKATLWILPITATPIYMGMTMLNKYPHFFNYPSTITAENAERQYRIATRMLRWLKMIVLFVFLVINAEVIITARTKNSFDNIWLIVIFMIACTVPVVISLILSRKKGNS